MNTPFALLGREPSVRVALFGKKDGIESDNQAAAAIGARECASLHQVHGNRTVVVSGPTDRSEEADGMLTDVPGLALVLRAADCQNFIVYAPRRRVVGVLHAGWKGILAGAIPAFFAVLKTEWGIDGSEVLVGAGPSLCTQCADFSDPLRELPGFPPDLIKGKHADLRKAADRQLLASGVPASAIDRSLHCTRCSPELYWTYRGGDREAVIAGRTNRLVGVLAV